MKKLEKEQYDNYCNQTNMGLYFTSKNIFLEQQDLEQKKHSIELEIERRKIEYKNEKLLLPFTAITQIYNASQIFKK